MIQSTKYVTAISLKTKILQTKVRTIRYVSFFLKCNNLCILKDIHMYYSTAYRKLLLLTLDCNKTFEGKKIRVSTDYDYGRSITHQFLSITFNDPNRAADPIPFNRIIVTCALASKSDDTRNVFFVSLHPFQTRSFATLSETECRSFWHRSYFSCSSCCNSLHGNDRQFENCYYAINWEYKEDVDLSFSCVLL